MQSKKARVAMLSSRESVRFLNNIHSTRLGRRNRLKTMAMGGIRRRVREEEIEMILYDRLG